MQKELYSFFDKTKQLHTWLCFTLFLTIIVIVFPVNIKPFGHIVIVGILSYILYHIYIETHKFSQLTKKNKDTDIKNNIIASYVLCVFILLLVLYVAYSAL